MLGASKPTERAAHRSVDPWVTAGSCSASSAQTLSGDMVMKGHPLFADTSARRWRLACSLDRDPPIRRRSATTQTDARAGTRATSSSTAVLSGSAQPRTRRSQRHAVHRQRGAGGFKSTQSVGARAITVAPGKGHLDRPGQPGATRHPRAVGGGAPLGCQPGGRLLTGPRACGSTVARSAHRSAETRLQRRAADVQTLPRSVPTCSGCDVGRGRLAVIGASPSGS